MFQRTVKLMSATQLNGPQTTGRDYRHLSEPTHRVQHDHDLAIAMSDGVDLLADVHRPDADGRFPVLIAASPTPDRSRTSVRQWVSSRPVTPTSG